MKRKSIKIVTLSAIILITGIFIGFILRHNNKSWELIKSSLKSTYNEFDDTRRLRWNSNFNEIEIISSLDNEKQMAYFLKSNSKESMPLIVSLHSWSGFYYQNNPIADLALKSNFNFISPDFRGANNHPKACCSEYVIQDIDDAITYAINNSNVDTSKIWVVGGSGGGYAALCLFMKSKHNISKFFAWNPITDLLAWYDESKIKGNKYALDILKCTNSELDKLNIQEAKTRSPLFMEAPIEKITNTQIHIFAGGYDGLIGSVSPTHSINFYNYLVGSFYPNDSLNIVTVEERLHLLEKRSKLGEVGLLDDREIFLKKESGNLRLTIFEGGHEILWNYAFDLLKE